MAKDVLTDVVVSSDVDGNVFAVVGAVSRELKRAGYHSYAKEVFDRMRQCGSYDEVIQMTMEYITWG